METAVELRNDERFNKYEENVDRVLRNLSVFSEYPDLPYTEETGPGMFVVLKLDEGRDEFAEKTETNAWFDIDDGKDVYLDGNPNDVYRLLEDSVLPDGALVVTPHGVPMEYNQHYNVPDNIVEEVDTTGETGSKHKSARAVSAIPNTHWTKVLSAKEGSIITYRQGEEAHPPVERGDLIQEVEEGQAEWIIGEVAGDLEEYDWLDIADPE